MTAAAGWPPAVFAAPLLRGLDVGSRIALVAAGRLHERATGAAIYREGDDSDAFFVVIAGAVELRAIRRGDEQPSVLRTARAGDAFGEEALLPGVPRRVTAIAVGATHVAEIPIAVFRRVTGKAGAGGADREWRYLQRAAARDLLACSAFARELGADDVDLLLDGLRLERFARGARIFDAGDRATELFLVVEGLIQLQRDDAGRTSVCAYLARGDFFGDQDALANAPRATDAVAAGDTWCAVVPREVLGTLSDRNPGLLARLRRVAEVRGADQAAVVGAAAATSTQHVFRDLYRMQMARSLLVIDQDRCVRCGHCAWSCGQVHGQSRLVRRGDKVVTSLTVLGAGAATLLLPNTCQHCRNAACMIDCPTGAIGRDPEGEVFIRPELCTGCGNCAKACPWDNIAMAPRAPQVRDLLAIPTARPLSLDVAVKCDLCRGYQAPACVEACPTGALLRLDPARDVAEVARVLGAPAPIAPSTITARASSTAAIAAATAVAIALAGVAWAQQRAGAWVPRRGAGLGCGALAGLALLALAGYALPKRLVRRRLRVRAAGARRAHDAGHPPRSRTRGPLIAHVALGALAPAIVVGHVGARVPASAAGALVLALALATVVGAVGAVAYRAIPRALTRLERRGSLPEDLAGERAALRARLYRETSGTSELVKRLAERLLLPYAHAPLGWIALIASGRGLADEQRRLRARIDATLQGRGADRLDGLDPLIAVAVELRAWPARRALGGALRAWLPLHIVSAAMVVALLLVHVAAVLR